MKNLHTTTLTNKKKFTDHANSLIGVYRLIGHTCFWVLLFAGSLEAQAPTCGTGTNLSAVFTGAAAVNTMTGTVGSSANALGVLNGTVATIAANSSLTLDMGSTLLPGDNVFFRYNSSAVTAPMQVLVSTAAGGPFTNILQLAPTTTMTTEQLVLPLSARYFQFVTNAQAFNLDAMYKADYSCQPDNIPTCTATQFLTSYNAGIVSIGATTGSVSNTSYILGAYDGAVSTISANSSMIADYGSSLPNGTVLTVHYTGPVANPLIVQASNSAGGPFIDIAQLPGTAAETSGDVTLPITARYVKFVTAASAYTVDAASYKKYVCVANPVPTCAVGETLLNYTVGVQSVAGQTGTPTNPLNAVGEIDGDYANIAATQSVTLDFGSVIAAGTTLSLRYNSTNVNPLQVSVATAVGGPYTNIAQVPSNATVNTYPIVLPLSARYVQLAAVLGGGTFNVDALVSPQYVCVTPATVVCTDPAVAVQTETGATAVTATTGTVTTGTNALGSYNGTDAVMAASATLTLDMGSVITAGNSIRVYYNSTSVSAPVQVLVATASGGPYTNIIQLPGSTTKTYSTILLPLSARYIQFVTNTVPYDIDAVTKITEMCVTEPSLSCTSSELLSSYKQGAQALSGTTVGTVATPSNALQPIDGTTANMSANSEFTVDMGTSMSAGTRLSVTYVASATTAPLQISVATASGGPYTTVKQLPGVTTSTTASFLLPIAGQFVRFNTTAVTFNIDAVTFPVLSCVPDQAPTCSGGQVRLKYDSGLGGAGATTGTVTAPTNLLDNVNGTETTFNPNASLVVNYDAAIPAGTVLTFNYRTNTTGISPMYVWASTTAGGPYTNIAQLEPSTTATTATVILPAAAQYFKLETNSIYYYIDAVTYPVYACVTPPASACASGNVSASYPVGLVVATQTVATVTTPANAIGTLNATTANMSANSEMSANFASALPAGTVLKFTYVSGSLVAPLQVLASSAAGGPFTNIAQLPGSTTTVTNTVTLPFGAQYLKLQTNATNYNIDAVTYLENVCVASPVPVCAANQVQTSFPTGVASVFTTTGTVTTATNIVGTLNGLNAVISLNSSLTADMGSLLTAGTEVTLNYLSNTVTGYLQVEVAATSGGPYTNISQVPGSTAATTGSFVLPFAARFIRLTTGASSTFTLDAMTYLNYSCVSNPVSTCAANEVSVGYPAGLTAVSSTSGTVTTSTNITGTQNGNNAVLSANASLTADFGSVLPAGTTLTFRYSSGAGTAALHVSTSAVSSSGPFTEVLQIPVSGTTINYTFVLPFATQYIQLDADAVAFTIDAITYPINTCVANPLAACPSGQTQLSYPIGVGSVVGVPVGATNPLNLLGTMDGAEVNLAANGQITGDLGMNYPAGSVLTFHYNSNALTAPMQLSVATVSGGPYTNIAQIPASTTVTSAMVTVPFATRYVRLNTTGVVFNIDAVTRLEYVCVPDPGPNCTTAETLVSALNGVSSIAATTGTVGTSTNLTGLKDGLTTSIAANATITGDFGQLLDAGTPVTIYYTASSTAAPLRFYIAPALAGPYTDIAQLTPSLTATNTTITLTAAAQYIKLESAATAFTVDAITYSDKVCITPTAHSCPVGFRSSIFQAGTSGVVTSTGTVATPANATGTWNGTVATINTTESLTLDLGATANAGDPITVNYYTNTAAGQFEILGATASAGPYTHLGYALGSTTATSVQFTLNTNVHFVKVVALGLTLYLDAVTYNQYECVAYDGISGCVFYDANNNGANDAELGVGGVTIKAYNASNTLVSTVVSSYGVPALFIPTGYYEFADLTPGAWYRLEYEFSTNSGLFSSMEGTDNHTSVAFVQGGSTDHCFGVYQPSLFCSVLENPRVMGATGSLGGAHAVFSWRYYDRSVDVVNGTATPASLTRDVTYSQTGAIWGMASQRGTNLVYAGALTADFAAAFPASPDGPSAIYILDYNSANGLQDYVGYKHLVNLSDLGIDVSTQNPTRLGTAYTFGEVGLGGLDISEDGKFLYVMNMGNGKLVKIDISGVDYDNLPATAPTSAVQINIPASITQCGDDVFRPTLVKNYNNKIYVGGVCDGTTSGNANLEAKLLTYDPATGNWAEVLAFPLNFTTGGISHSGAPQTRWDDYSSFTVQNQPVFADLAFDNDGSMSLGFVNRFVLIAATTSTQTGYMLRTYIDANGNQQLENNGIAGPHTTLIPNDGAQGGADGPGTNWFYQQSSYSPNHIYTFNGGLFQKPGEAHVVAGVVDPHNAVSNGGTYYNVNTGIQEYNIMNEAGIAKVARITGGEQVCEAIPEIEIGNRVWVDLNGNGIQDAGDPGIGNVAVELYADLDNNGVPDGTALATTTTASNGTWYFNAGNVPDGDPSSPGNQAGLLANTGYVVQVGNSDWAAGVGAGDLLNFTLTSSNIGGAGQPDVRDNDAILPASNIPTIALKTGAQGENNHTYDMGFLQSCAITVTSATPTACVGNLYNVAVVVTYTNPPSGNITVNTSNGGTITVAQTSSPQTITLTGLTADGVQDIDVTAFFVVTPTCTNTAMDVYDAPVACPCTITVTSATPTACAGNLYNVAVVVTYANQPSGNITVNTSNGGTVTVAQTSSPQTITLTGLTADGVQDIDVTAFFVATPACTNTGTDIYDAPAACPCTITVTSATPTACASNLYNVAVVVTYANQPGGNITVNTSNGGTVTVAQTSSPQTITLTGLAADGVQDIDVTAFFVADPVCTNTGTDIYDAPVACNICIQPAANFVPIPARCINLVPQNDGRIVLTAFSNADRFGVNAGNMYSGPAYAGASTILGVNQNLQTGIPNVGGGTYTVRIFNGSNTCYRDYVITVKPATPCRVDPMGYVYCEETGQVILGGTITVTPPAGATYIITQDGATGMYQFFTDAFVSGVYTMTYTPPAGYMLSTTRLPGPTLDPTGQPDPYTLGSGSTGGVLNDFTAAANPFYMSFDFVPSDPEILNNNIPLKGCCIPPVLTVGNGQVCNGGSIDLATLVSSAGGGTLSYHTTLADAQNDTGALPSAVVSPASATNYYVRSEINTTGGQTCYTVKEVIITIKATSCGAITISGPN